MLTITGIIFALLTGTLFGILLTEKAEDTDYDDYDDDYW